MNVLKNKHAKFLSALIVTAGVLSVFYFLSENIGTAEAEVVTVQYSAAVSTSWIVPDGVTSIDVYLWGAGGGGGGTAGVGGVGGGGAFASSTISVTPGETLTIEVGGGGDGATTGCLSNTGGGTGGLYTGGDGGDGGTSGCSGAAGAGGGGTFVKRSSTILIAAGAGGGGGGAESGTGGAGGAGGVNGSNGGTGATGGTAGGSGTSSGTAGGTRSGDGSGSGGGGGGYLGGTGGTAPTADTYGAGGGGGTSYGDTIINGAGASAANTSDIYYSGSAGAGGGVITDGNDGRLVFRYTSPATTWNATDWTDYIAITIDADKIDSTLTDFPVYVNLANMPDYFWSSVRDDCGDIRVMNSELTVEMPREIVSCDTSAGTGEMHFKANSISSSADTTFYIYFNNTDDYPYGDSHTYGAQNVWTNDYLGVWHLDESVNNDSRGYKDSTANGNDGTGTSMALTEVSGQMGSGQDFDGTADFITINENVPINPYDSVTVSAWLAPDAYNEWGSFVGNYYDNADGTESGWGLLSMNTDSFGFFTETADTTGTNSTGSCGDTSYVCNSTNVLNNGWHYLVGTYQGTEEKLYLDYDTEQDTNTSPGGALDYTPDNPLYFGVFKDSNETEYINGQIDEVRIASSSRSAAWIKAEYYNQAEEAFFVAPTWTVDEWQDRVKITVDAANISSTLTDFPVYVDLADLDPYFFDVVRHDCGDIRIMSENLATEMPREVVSCSAASSTGEVHFKANSISSSVDTVFWLYYNNSEAFDYAPADTYGAENVWSNNYVAVWHMNEDPSSQSIADSTSNRHHGIPGGTMTSSDVVAGAVGNAINFDGSNDVLDTGNSYTNLTQINIAAWIRPTGWGESNLGRILDQNNDLQIATRNSGAPLESFKFRKGFSTQTGDWATPASSLSLSVFQYVNVDHSNLQSTAVDPTLYINNSSLTVNEYNTPSGSSFNLSGQTLYIGSNAATDRSYQGDIDELRISSTTRSSAWISAEYLNQATTTDFYSISDNATVWNAIYWTDYIAFTINATNIDEDLTDFPVYVDLSDFPSGLLWANVNADCGDIRITTDDGSPVELPREVVACDTGAETGELHFKANSISSTTNTVFRLYYNNSTAEDYAPYSTYGAHNVWTNEYVSVWHLGDDPVSGVIDSTGNGYTGTGFGDLNSSDLVSGKMASGTALNGSDQMISFGDMDVLDTFSNNSFSVWFYRDTDNSGTVVDTNHVINNVLFAQSSQISNDNFEFGTEGTNFEIYVDTGSSGGANKTISEISSSVADDTWQYAYFTYDSSSSTETNIYLNGVHQYGTSTFDGALGSSSLSPLTIGGARPGDDANGDWGEFIGTLDEARVASSTRSAAWIKAEYYNQNNTASFYSIDQAAPTPNPAYFAIAPDDTGTGPYDISSPTFVATTSLETGDKNYRELLFNDDGTKLIVIADAPNEIYEYTVGTPFDISTLTFVDATGVGSYDTEPRGLAFNNDGTKIYIAGDSNAKIFEFDLSPAYDISTLSFSASTSINSQDPAPRGIAFNNDGTKFYLVGAQYDRVYEYSVGTPYDITTLTYVDYLSVGSQDGNPWQLTFTPDGRQMFINGAVNDDVYEYVLPVAFDVSTASHTATFSIAYESDLTGLTFGANGTKMYGLGTSQEKLIEYDLAGISMTSVTATDANTVEYYFASTTGSCGANLGTGGTDSGWQTSALYTDTGLQPNKCYAYTVTARDIYENYGATSTASSTYSAAAIPGLISLSNVGPFTLDINNDDNGNPSSNPTTYFAVQVSATSPTDGTWDGMYVNASGNPSGSAVWLTDAQIDGLTVNGLQDVTQYTFKAKARNEDLEETSFGPTSATTTPDGTAPTPDPMTFSLAPDGTSSTTIAMIATTASDDNTIEYFFEAVTGSCGASLGTGGTDSGWQSGTSYTDTGLQPNHCYAYTVTTRDSLRNYGATSSASAAYTEALTPAAPTITAYGTTTLTITNNENGNPTSNPSTEFALQIYNSEPTDVTWHGKYVDASGDPSDTAVWLSDATLDGMVIQGLLGGAKYTLRVKARNGDGDETPFSSTADSLTAVAENPRKVRLIPGARLTPGVILR